MNEKYLNYINNFRGFVIVLIVGVHCVSSELMQWSTSFDMRKLLHAVLHGSSLFYVFIAGFLFQFLIDKYNYFSYLRRKFLYIFLPYLVVSIPAIIDEIYSPKAIYASLPIWKQVFIYYATGIHMSHFWFVPMILIYYIISPIFVLINKYNRSYFVIPLLMMLAVFVPREIYPTHNPIFSGLHFLGFYTFGMWVSYKRVQILELSNYYLVGVILFLLIFYWSWTLSLAADKNEYLVQFLYVLKFSIACIVLVCIFFKYDKKMGHSLNFLAAPSFGIYFLHNYFIVIIEKILYKINFKIEGGLLALLMWILIITSLTYIFVKVTKIIFGVRSKILIGY